MSKTGGDIPPSEADDHRMKRVLNNCMVPVMPLRHREIETAGGPREGEELEALGVGVE